MLMMAPRFLGWKTYPLTCNAIVGKDNEFCFRYIEFRYTHKLKGVQNSNIKSSGWEMEWDLELGGEIQGIKM